MPSDFNIPMTDAQITQALQMMVERVSEGWDQGTYDGSPVGPASPYYQNNSKYWAQQAADAAARAEGAVPAGTAGAVFFDRAQSLTTAQQEQARQNIKAGGSNPNLLDNPWWGSAEIINQRGATSGSITSGVYNFDRWKGAIGGTGGNFEITANGVALTVTGTYVQYRQHFEDVTRLEGKTLTASVLLSNGTIYSGTLTRVNGTVQTFFNQTNVIAVLFQSDNTLRVTAYTNLTIRAVKLELGTISTLANDTAPNYQQELAKCQRYFFRLNATAANAPMGTAIGLSTAAGRLFIPTPVSMRKVSPTITYNTIGSFHLIGDGDITPVSVTSLGAETIHDNGVALGFTAGANTITNRKIYALTSQVATGYIDISADL